MRASATGLAAFLCLLAMAPAAKALGLTPVEQFVSPVHVTAPPGDGRRVYVVEQGGTVRVVRDGVELAEPFLDATSVVLAGGERGLLSIAFPPDYESTRLFYAYYTNSNGDIEIDEFRRSPSSRDLAEDGYRRPVLTIPHPGQANHNGGQVQFGPDGYLWAATGDGGGSYDPGDNAQDPDSLLGKVLRIQPRQIGVDPYTVPADNPYFGASAGADEIWASGLRNPFRFSFDRQNGDLTIGDVGQGTIEELDFSPSAGGPSIRGKGANYGWDECEGNFAAKPEPTGVLPCPLVGDVRPVIEHTQTAGWRSIIAGYVVRDPSLESLLGRYVYGDFFVANLYSALLGLPTASDDRAEPNLAVSQLSGFGEDACGRIYIAELGGRVARIEDDTPGCDVRVPEPGDPDPDPNPNPDPDPGGGSGGGGTGAGAGEGKRLGLDVRARRRQRALRRRGVLIRVRCTAPCRLRAFGRLSIGRRGREVRLREVKRRLPGAKTVTLRLRLFDGGRRALRRALRGGRRVRARLTVRARDAAGNLIRRTLVIRLVR